MPIVVTARFIEGEERKERRENLPVVNSAGGDG